MKRNFSAAYIILLHGVRNAVEEKAMVGDVLTLAGGDDGSGFDHHWRGWSASVDGLDEAVIEEEKRRVAEQGRMIGTVALIGEANDPLRAMAEKQMRQALGGLGIGMVSMN